MSGIEQLRTAQEIKWIDRDRRLFFRPPAMVNPYIIHAPTNRVRFPNPADDSAVSYEASDGNYYFNPSQDVVIYMPTAAVSMAEDGWVRGGRHVRVIGGHLTRNSAQSNIFNVSLQTGSVFIEGMYADVAGGECDGIVIGWNQTIANEQSLGRTTQPGVTIQHCLIEGIDGSPAGIHGDAVQNQSEEGLDYLRIEEFTFESTYQGIFPIASAGGPTYGLWLRKVNSRDYVAGTDELASYWFYDGSAASRTTPLYPIHLSLVYAANPQSDPWEDRATSPNETHTGWGPTLDTDADGDFFDFASLGLQMTGIVRRGQPPGGDFVSAASVGVDYRSPWGMP